VDINLPFYVLVRCYLDLELEGVTIEKSNRTTLSRTTQRSTGKRLQNTEIASKVTESGTKFQLSPTAVATVSHTFCPLHGMLNDPMFHTTHLSRRLRKHYKTSCVKDYAE